MFGSVESFYQALASGTRKLASTNPKASRLVAAAAAMGVSSKAVNSIVKAPRTMADRLYPQASAPMGAGKYGLGSGGAGSDLGSVGLKFSFGKKRR